MILEVMLVGSGHFFDVKKTSFFEKWGFGHECGQISSDFDKELDSGRFWGADSDSEH